MLCDCPRRHQLTTSRSILSKAITSSFWIMIVTAKSEQPVRHTNGTRNDRRRDSFDGGTSRSIVTRRRASGFEIAKRRVTLH